MYFMLFFVRISFDSPLRFPFLNLIGYGSYYDESCDMEFKGMIDEYY
jgi:hypothetical protein